MKIVKFLILPCLLVFSATISAMEDPAERAHTSTPALTFHSAELTTTRPESFELFEKLRPVFIEAFLAPEIDRFNTTPAGFDEEDLEKINANLHSGMPLDRAIGHYLYETWNWVERVEEDFNEVRLTYVQDNDNIVAFALFSWSKRDRSNANLDFIAILPAYQGFKLSRRLIFSILAPYPKIQNITLTTTPSYEHAHDIYKHFGFKKEEEDAYTIRLIWRKDDAGGGS